MYHRTMRAIVMGLGILAVSPPIAIAAEFISIKGGQVRGAFNRTANGWAAYVTENVPEIRASAEASAGSLDNIRTLQSGDAEFGVAFASDAYSAHRGEAPFETATDKLRAATYLFGSVGHFVVPADSDIQEIADIKGKTISMGGPGSGSAKSLQAILEHIGLWGEFDPVYAGRKSPEELRNGNIAAYNWHPGLGNAMIRDTAAAMPIRFIDMNKPAVETGFYDAFPYYGPTVIPAGTYPGVDVDTETFGTGTLMLTHADVPEDLVYNVLKAVYSDAGKEFLISAAGQVASQMTTDNAVRTVTIPLHPGAVRFFEEAGVTIPDELKSDPAS
ncbi:MAG: TAXI family TRAP transporter solute-binding subunit [Pseudomonadota bacterium]